MKKTILKIMMDSRFEDFMVCSAGAYVANMVIGISSRNSLLAAISVVCLIICISLLVLRAWIVTRNGQ